MLAPQTNYEFLQRSDALQFLKSLKLLNTVKVIEEDNMRS